MLCSKFKQIILPQPTLHNNVQFRCYITSRIIIKKWVSVDYLLASLSKKDTVIMSPLRIILMDLRLWSGWTRSIIVNTMAKRYRKEFGVREVIHRFRQTFCRPRRTLLISATAAYKARDDNDESSPPCDNSITNAELEELLKDLEAVEMLSRSTLFCIKCGKRLVINKKQPGVQYCSCKITELSKEPDSDGWVPYMEAEDVIIWRKEYKPGLGLYAYKVYGRYPEVRAEDFAAVQMDSAYRRHWDSAVAALAVVENSANGLPDQAVLHWEVLWPRLFANRDYVYIRRHKEFNATDKSARHREGLFQPTESTVATQMITEPIYKERQSVHSNAKRKSLEEYSVKTSTDNLENKVYVIINRSCEHPDVPETKHAIRVYEYWSHMVVKTMYGTDKCGMEFVLTYYDEPAVGGMPSSVASWATGRAAPAYLQRMRRAALDYQTWRHDTPQESSVSPFVIEPSTEKEDKIADVEKYNEQDMESTQMGPELETVRGSKTRDQGTQTEETCDKVTQVTDSNTEDKSVGTDRGDSRDASTSPVDSKTLEEDEPKSNGHKTYSREES